MRKLILLVVTHCSNHIFSTLGVQEHFTHVGLIFNIDFLNILSYQTYVLFV